MKLTLMGIAGMDKRNYPTDLFAYNLGAFVPVANYLEIRAKNEVYW
jgi:hypothetical protein